jgi:hypothetical protein
MNYSGGIWVGSEDSFSPENVIGIIETHGDYEVGNLFCSTYFKLKKRQLYTKDYQAGWSNDHKIAPLELTMWKDT